MVVNRRIGAVDGRADGKVEGVVGVDRLQMRGRVIGNDLGIDADLAERLAQIGANCTVREEGRRSNLR